MIISDNVNKPFIVNIHFILKQQGKHLLFVYCSSYTISELIKNVWRENKLISFLSFLSLCLDCSHVCESVFKERVLPSTHIRAH